MKNLIIYERNDELINILEKKLHLFKKFDFY